MVLVFHFTTTHPPTHHSERCPVGPLVDSVELISLSLSCTKGLPSLSGLPNLSSLCSPSTMLAKLIGSTAFRLRILTRFALPLRKDTGPPPPGLKVGAEKTFRAKKMYPSDSTRGNIELGGGVF